MNKAKPIELIIDFLGEWNLGTFFLVDQLLRCISDPPKELKTFHLSNFGVSFQKHQVAMVENNSGRNSARYFHWSVVLDFFEGSD